MKGPLVSPTPYLVRPPCLDPDQHAMEGRVLVYARDARPVVCIDRKFIRKKTLRPL